MDKRQQKKVRQGLVALLAKAIRDSKDFAGYSMNVHDGTGLVMSVGIVLTSSDARFEVLVK